MLCYALPDFAMLYQTLLCFTMLYQTSLCFTMFYQTLLCFSRQCLIGPLSPSPPPCTDEPWRDWLHNVYLHLPPFFLLKAPYRSSLHLPPIKQKASTSNLRDCGSQPLSLLQLMKPSKGRRRDPDQLKGGSSSTADLTKLTLVAKSRKFSAKMRLFFPIVKKNHLHKFFSRNPVGSSDKN